jgi:hypothetical protein
MHVNRARIFSRRGNAILSPTPGVLRCTPETLQEAQPADWQDRPILQCLG